MSAAHSELAAIDAAIAKGEWWMTLFDALAKAGMNQANALKADSSEGLARVVQLFCRVAGAVRLAIVAAMRLDVILHGLADLRRLAPEAIAAAKARALARAEEAAAAQAKARDTARAKYEAQDRETLDRKETVLRDRDRAVEALDRRLTVDPAGVDFDALPLRRTVERICAALKITPDWRRWEAGDWSMSNPPHPVHLDVQPHIRATPPADQSLSRTASPTLPGLKPRRTDNATALAVHDAPNAPPWPPLE